MPEFLSFGEAYPDLNSGRLTQEAAKRTLSVCQAHKDFEVVELRCLKRPDQKVSDIIVVDCINGKVPSRNLFGIKVPERLALVFTSESSPEVRALRRDFPGRLPHLNYVGLGQPAWLCIYFEPWSTVERNWTPQKFLQRILWWLSETAKGTLHREDQPLEQLYFNSLLELILPPDFEVNINNPQLSFTCVGVEHSKHDVKVIRGLFVSKTEAQEHKIFRTEVLILELPPVTHGTVDFYPKTLGQFHDQLEHRGAKFIDKINNVIKQKAAQRGLTRDPQGRCLLIFTIPVKRTADAEPKKYEVVAFILTNDLATLGLATGILTVHGNKLYATPIIGASGGEDAIAWRELEAHPVEVKRESDKAFARKASGVNKESADFKGVLLGVGALGSSLAELWSREAWGEWTLIDPDILEAHNTVRHSGRNPQVEHYKVDAVKFNIESNYHPQYYNAIAIVDSATNSANKQVTTAISGAELMVDATTTLNVPRDLSQRDETPRAASVFLTPSGDSSVLLLEPSNRSLRLDSLEAQYYRSIIASDWGATHLNGHKGVLWVGAGCRDVSAVISNEAIQLHAAVIAKQIRLLRDKPEAHIRVWTADPDTGALRADDITVEEKMWATSGEWTIIWDAGLYQKLCSMRQISLPNETGGIVLGYIDQKIKSIFIVDALPAPLDSESEPTGFTRGIQGLEASLNDIARRTANMVGYIGEWHSHPPFVSASPSNLDRTLIENLAYILALDGQPALMMIVGSAGEMSVSLREG